MGAAESPWYVAAALGGHETDSVRRRPRAAVAGLLALALALSVAACGGDESSDANEPAGTYSMRVVDSTLPIKQRLGETVLWRLAVRNTGDESVPALTVNVSLGGKEGQGSTLPFAIRDPQPGLAQPDRPVWVLAESYPRFAGAAESAGAETSNQKTFDFGSLEPGATANLVWKLSAVRSGRHVLTYAIDAGLSGAAKAKTDGGVEPGGSFTVQVSSAPRDTEVTDSGEVVPRSPSGQGSAAG